MNEEYTNPYWSNLPAWGSQNVNQFGDSGEYGDFEQPQSAGMSYGNATSAVGGAAAGASGQHQGYQPGQFAAFEGAAKGYAAGGMYGAVAGAVAAPVSQVVKSHRNLNNLDTSVGSMQTDIYGRPVYDGSAVSTALNKLPELDKTAKWDSTNALGLGNKAKRKRRQLLRGLQQNQNAYNQSESNFRQRSIGMQEYQEKMNNSYRNLYSY